MSNEQKKKQYPKFTDYYADEEYRQKHLARMKERVVCECGAETSRVNSYAHKKSGKHLAYVEKKKLEEQIKKLKKNLKK